MPHKEYIQRLIHKTEKSSSTPGAGSNQQREIDVGPDRDRGTIKSRAIAILKDDGNSNSESSNDSDGGGRSSQLYPPLTAPAATPEKSSIAIASPARSTARSTSRISSPSRQRHKIKMGGKDWNAKVQRRLKNAKGYSLGLGSSPGSIGSRSLSAAASRHSGRSPANSIASAHNAGSLAIATDILGMPRSNNNILRPASYNNNTVAAKGMRSPAYHSVDHSPSKSEMFNTPRRDRANTTALNDQSIGLGTPQRSTPSSRRKSVIDLTENDSGENAGQQKTRVFPSQMVRDDGLEPLHQKPGVGQKKKKENSAVVQQKGNNLTVSGCNHLVVHSSNQEQNRVTVNNAPKPSSVQEQQQGMAGDATQPTLSMIGHTVNHSSNQKQNGVIVIDGPKLTSNHEEMNKTTQQLSEGTARKPEILSDKENHGETMQPSNKMNQNTPLSNSETHSIAAVSKKSTSPTKRKPNGTSRKSVRAKRTSAKKTTPSCTLIGKLTCAEKEGKHCQTIRGYWEYKNHPGSTPQRYELCRSLPSDVESMPLTAGGIFQGSFVYQWLPKGKPATTFVIKEDNVHLSFVEQQGEGTSSLAVTGTGQNELGKFVLHGTARQSTVGKSYYLQLTKDYTELFSSKISQPGPNDNEKKISCGQKRTFSMLDTSGSEGPSVGGEKELRKEFSREISISSRASNVSDNAGMFTDTSGHDEVAETSNASAQQGRKTIFAVTQAVATVKYDPSLMLLTNPECVPLTNSSHNGKNCKSWQEFGDIQDIDHHISAQTLSWNVKNVKPQYSQMICDFFYTTGIVNVQDLLEADTDFLGSCLLDFNEFKAACAFEVWMRKTGPQKHSGNGRQVGTFHSLYSSVYARQSILAWKQTAESWYKEVSGEDFVVKPDSNYKGPDRNQAQVEQRDSEMEEECCDDQVPLKNILGCCGASILRNDCNITTAKQLLGANGKDTIKRLVGVVGRDFQGRQEKDIQLIVEGMLYAWSLDAKQALQANESTAVDNTMNSPGLTPSPESCKSFQTPLSYVDLEFIRSQNITSDQQLSGVDPTYLAHRYIAFLRSSHDEHISLTEAFETVMKWKQGARLVCGLCSEQDICDTLPQNTRLGKDSSAQVTMNTVLNLCKTVPDRENGGLPRRTIFTFDRTNSVLYEFLVSVKKSTCSPDAGWGAFLTFKGARVLRRTSEWKKKGNIALKQTRKPLEALFSFSGATVTLRGVDLHGDERQYGPERGDSVGLYREFTLDDFIDSKDNITFSSKHMGCALVELESRYAPLLKQDRKTDKVFIVKDFLFSNEPSSWRFDVAEPLNGHPQVVDFTSDTTGAPHEVAQSHMSMYVNEVGHNLSLVENVEALSETPRSVTYFMNIDKPLTKGETVELLVNYKEHYESMRERRGYGKANLSHGAKSDAHDITRVLRNLEERFLVEASILKFTEDELIEVIDFIIERVWDGVKSATTTFETSCQKDDSNFLRQLIALRRMDWLSKILQKRFHEIIGSTGIQSLPFPSSSDEDGIFQKHMLVFVHDWPKNDPRPAYTGLATITKISKDEHKRNVFELSLSDGKYIEYVPEAVVTIPTDDDFKGLPKRIYSNWMKWKKQQDLPRRRMQMIRAITTVEWNPTFIQDISAVSASSSFEMQAKAFQSLRWEFAEELLFLLVQNKRLSQPFDEQKWCQISVSLLEKSLHLIADFLLFRRCKPNISKTLMVLARDAANEMKNLINNSSKGAQDLSTIGKLAFHENIAAQKSIHWVVVEAVYINQLSIEEYSEDPKRIDLEWYLVHQIVLAIHPLASLIDWGDNPPYSMEGLCDYIGLDKDAPYLTFFAQKTQDWRPLL